jgi:undecaprenyl pyrophosphate phosphatase UppP
VTLLQIIHAVVHGYTALLPVSSSAHVFVAMSLTAIVIELVINAVQMTIFRRLPHADIRASVSSS